MRRHIVALLIGSAVLALSACTGVQAPAAPEAGASGGESEAVVINSPADVPRIGVDEAKAHFDDGTAVFIDSRSLQAYSAEHIAGALPPPSGDLSELGNAIPEDQLIIAYCT